MGARVDVNSLVKERLQILPRTVADQHVPALDEDDLVSLERCPFVIDLIVRRAHAGTLEVLDECLTLMLELRAYTGRKRRRLDAMVLLKEPP